MKAVSVVCVVCGLVRQRRAGQSAREEREKVHMSLM